MDNLISFARRFKGFLAFAALIFLGLIFLVNYLFSKGSFDRILAGFGNLSPNQFLSVVYIALGLPFIIIILLIILSYRNIAQESAKTDKPQSGLIYVIVHDSTDKTKGIDDAEVRLMLPEPRSTRTDGSGGAKFAFPAECANGTFLINASKESYQSGKPQQVKMVHGVTVTIALKREPQQSKQPTIKSEDRTKPSTSLSVDRSEVRSDSNTGTAITKNSTEIQAIQPNKIIRLNDTRALVGLAIDLSGSMAQSIQNNTGGKLSRLESFRQSLDRLVREARTAIHESRNRDVQTSVELFAYGFGLRGISVCDLLSLVKVGHNIISQDEIESLKQKYISEMKSKYSRYAGLGDIASQYGLGNIARDFERSARANAEAEIRRRIMLEVKSRIEKQLDRVGDTTLPIEEVAQLWDNSAETIGNAEELIYGNTPMREAMQKIEERFQREMKERSKDITPALFVLSDGEPTDGDPLPIAQSIKSKSVKIISCLITDQDIANPRTLFKQPEPHWDREAKLMFDMASKMEDNSEFERFLSQKGWTIHPEAKLFVQLNHSEILEEFISMVLIPFTEPDLGGILPRGI